MQARILFVDDEPLVLEGLLRSLRHVARGWDVRTATDPREAIEQCRREHVSVVVADQRMPTIDGLECLEQIKAVSPQTIRMMLTGNTDARTAIEAVNLGEVYRYFVKPVGSTELADAVQDAVRAHDVAAAEHRLLEETLLGSIKSLTEVLSVVSPLALARSHRIAAHVTHIVRHLKPLDGWQIEIAGMLSQVGCVTLPEEILTALEAGAPIDPADRKQVDRHPEIARALVAHIPRLHTVAEIIAAHLLPQSTDRIYAEAKRDDPVALGAQILRVATELDRLTRAEDDRAAIMARLRGTVWRADPALLAAAEHVEIAERRSGIKTVRVSTLTTGLILAEDLHADNGLLIVKRSQRVTPVLLERLRGLARSGRLSPARTVDVVSTGGDAANPATATRAG